MRSMLDARSSDESLGVRLLVQRRGVLGLGKGPAVRQADRLRVHRPGSLHDLLGSRQSLVDRIGCEADQPARGSADVGTDHVHARLHHLGRVLGRVHVAHGEHVPIPERPHHLDLAREAPGHVEVASGLPVLSPDLRVDDLASSLRGKVDDPIVPPIHESATQHVQIVDRLVAALHAGDDRRVPHHVADLVVHAQRLWIGMVDVDRLQPTYSRLPGAVADDQVGAADLGCPRDQASAAAGPYNRLAGTDRVPQTLADLVSFEPLLHCITSFMMNCAAIGHFTWV